MRIIRGCNLKCFTIIAILTRKYNSRYEKMKKTRCAVNWIEHIIEEEIKNKILVILVKHVH